MAAMRPPSTAAALLLATAYGAFVLNGAHAQVLRDTLKVKRAVNSNYPNGLAEADQHRRLAKGHTPYTYPDLAFYIQSSLNAYESGSLRRPVTSFPSHGGERDYAVAVWNPASESRAVFDDPDCVLWFDNDVVQEDNCADKANGLMWPVWRLGTPAPDLDRYSVAIFWHPTYTYAALERLDRALSQLRIKVAALLFECRYRYLRYNSLPPEERTQQAFLACIYPDILSVQPFEAGPLLLMPGRASSGSFTDETGGEMVIHFSKDLTEEAVLAPPGGHDWKLILSLRTEFLRAARTPTPPRGYRLRPQNFVIQG